MSTIMIPSQQYITVSVLDPVTQKAAPRNIQERTIQGFRNTGSCLVHVPPPSASHTSSSSTRPVAFECFDDLQRYHHPSYVYTLLSRPTYHISTFNVALSIIGDPMEPFDCIEDMRADFRDYYTLLANDERAAVTAKWSTVGPLRRSGFVTCRYDCLMENAQASAFVSSVTEAVSEEYIRDFHDRCHYAHFLSYTMKCERSRKRWSTFFSKPTYIYLGGLPPTPSAIRVAAELGVRLFAKAGLTYHALR